MLYMQVLTILTNTVMFLSILQIMEAISRELKARPANGERFIKALQHFCTRARENRWRLRCGRMAEAFSSLDEGLRGLRRQHRRGEEPTYEAVNTAVIQEGD